MHIGPGFLSGLNTIDISLSRAIEGESLQICCSSTAHLFSTIDIQLLLDNVPVNLTSSSRVSSTMNQSSSVVVFTIDPVELEDNGTAVQCVDEIADWHQKISVFLWIREYDSLLKLV